MTYSNIIVATVLLGFFFFGFSQAFFPTYNAWESAMAEYRNARTLRFVAESFRSESENPNRNIENWKRQIAVARELESYEVTELWQGEILRALKLTVVISGEHFEILGSSTP